MSKTTVTPVFKFQAALTTALLCLYGTITAHADEPTTGPSSNALFSSDSLKLTADQDTTFDSQLRATAARANGVFTLTAEPMTDVTDKTLTLQKPVWVGAWTILLVQSTSNFAVRMPSVISNQPGGRIKAMGARVLVGSMSGDIALDGKTVGNTLETFTGKTLQKFGAGSWTITGDNSKADWNTAVTEGELILDKKASLGSGSVHVLEGATFSPQAGTSVAGRLQMHDKSTLNLADGTIGTFTASSVFCGPNGGEVTLSFDIGSTGVDQLIIHDVADTNDIKDYVVLHRLTKKLTPGTYPLVVLKTPGRTLMENHLAFDFTGDPEDHHHMIMSKAEPDYTFTLVPVVDKAGNWTAENLVVSVTERKGGD